jgi:phosphate/sulfate permease
MENIFIVVVALLILLALSDLIVGVSNDAVNFLNSAIGSKAAPLRIVLIVAGAGVLVGATFSDGMMEVARKGIFNPSSYYFTEIMIIFLAVMFTDVLLLDLFNTFGLPTSTTVSIVFELLGAAVAVAIIKISHGSGDYSEMINYINSGKALAIISGILISVVISFSVGALVMYLSRLLFSFGYTNSLRYFGAIWGGLAISAITYFILIKGAKGSSIISEENLKWLQTNTMLIITVSFFAWTILLQFLVWVFKLNILKLIVLVGTFALAMAFAGNDLVNFIGVPLAGFESFKAYIASGSAPDTLVMTALAGKVKTPTLYLLIAGLIMVITLWLSKKSRSVVKTTLNLSDQEVVNERFESSGIARAIVRQSVKINKSLRSYLPDKFISRVESRFDTTPFKTQENQEAGVSFDLIRASVNLVVASILIALGTSLKLPLSTTYVTFMVAMGTSLADGAWDRESAVYRITGVITVIGGWFFTALSAFTIAFVIALFIVKTWLWGVFVLAGFTLFVVYRTHIIHKKKSETNENDVAKDLDLSSNGNDIYTKCSNNIASLLVASGKAFEEIVIGLSEEKRKMLKNAYKDINVLNDESKKLKKNIPRVIHQIGDEYMESGHYYVEVIDYTREAMHCLHYIAMPAYKHVDNNHKPLNQLQEESLKSLVPEINKFIKKVVESISDSDFSNSKTIIDESVQVNNNITKIRKKHLKSIKKDAGSTRTNLLYMDILNEAKNMILNINNVYKSFRDFSEENKQTIVRNGI